jgi:hypothetical protein
MKRITVVLTITAVLAALASPAMAAKPDKPPRPPGYSYYTLEIGGVELSTTCPDEDLVVRRNDAHFEWFYDEGDANLPDDIELRLAAPGLSWDGELISGCRNAGMVETYLLNGDVETSPAGGYFRITLEDDGTVAMLWIFDIYERYDEVQQNKKRTSLERTTRTDFRMGGPYVVDEEGNPVAEFAAGQWSEDDGIITGFVEGAFSFVHFDGGDFALLTNAVHDFGIAFTLTPVS